MVGLRADWIQAHTFIDRAPTKEIISLYKEKNAFVVPTLVVLTSLTGEEQALRERFADIASSKGLIDPTQKENMLASLKAPAEGASIEHAYESIRQLKAAGIDIAAGTDSVAGLQGTAIGPSLWQELWMYVEKCGFSIEEALHSATEVSARRLGFDDRGTVEVGKRADLLLVKGNVLDKLENLWEGEAVTNVWKEGIRAA
jgi:imidazolonepropionase-like amidohydrolase